MTKCRNARQKFNFPVINALATSREKNSAKSQVLSLKARNAIACTFSRTAEHLDIDEMMALYEKIVVLR